MKMDQNKIEEGVRLLLEGMGENPEREGLKETPARVARMFSEIYKGYGDDAAIHLQKTFSVEHSGLVLEKNIPVFSMCEHHMVPFYGKAHVAYMPDGKVVGLSKIARTVEVFSRRLQIQEKLTRQIAEAMMTCLQPQGVMVIIEAEHMCMTMRGVNKPGTRTMTFACRGTFENNIPMQNQVFDRIR